MNRDKQDRAIAQLGLRYDCLGEAYTYICRQRSLEDFKDFIRLHRQIQRKLGAIQ
jgi:hypothetical protein